MHKNTVFIGQFDTFERGALGSQNYQGDLSLIAVVSNNAFTAVRGMLDEIEKEGGILKEISFFGPISEFEDDNEIFDVNMKEFENEALKSGRMVFSNLVPYTD